MLLMNYQEVLKAAACASAGWLCAVVAPAVPTGAVCTCMVLADVVTARRLGRRLARRHPEHAARLRFCSERFGRVVSTLCRVYGALVLASMVEATVLGGGGALLRLVAGAVCFWQAVSMLENEASCNGARWAVVARKVLVDKTERHLGVSLDALRDESSAERNSRDVK